MSELLLSNSMFYDALFPSNKNQGQEGGHSLALRKPIRYRPSPAAFFRDSPWVVFDLETTGLDSDVDEIIEIGAQKIYRGEVVAEFSTLVFTEMKIPETVQKITGIDQSMLIDQPRIEQIIPLFLEFIQGSFLVAHNAAFDTSFINQACIKQDIELTWPVFCSLKLARELLPDLERKNLDTLAEHYQLQFESRHRSIGDVKVTSSVLLQMLSQEGEDLQTWQDLSPFSVAIHT